MNILVYFIVPCALHRCIYSLTIVAVIASDPICSWMKPEMYSTFYSTWLLQSLPFFLLTPFCLVQKMGLCVFFFPLVLKGSHLPQVLVSSYCPVISICSLSSPCTQLTSPWHLLTFFKKKKNSSHAKYITEKQNVS